MFLNILTAFGLLLVVSTIKGEHLNEEAGLNATSETPVGEDVSPSFSDLFYNLSRELETIRSQLKSEMETSKRWKSEVASMNHTLYNIKSGLSRDDVNFEATSSSHVTMHPYQIYKFDTVLLNNGGGYHAPTGIFEAPVSGTYLFWANVHNTNTPVHMRLYKEGHYLATSASKEHYGECSLLYLAEVRKGEKVWLRSDSYVVNIYGNKHARYGGILLRAK